MTTALERWLGEGTPTPAAIDEFLKKRSIPIVEGRRVTFVWRGPADAIHLRHFIYGLASTQPFRRVPDTDLWFLTMELPERSRVEYKIERIQGEDRAWLMDPLNPNVAHDPFGANSVCHGFGYETPEWTLPDDEARPGTIDELPFRSEAFEESRDVLVYLPARFRRLRRYPLLVVHDGPDYLRFSSLQQVLDNLIHRLELPPLIAAMPPPRERLREYADDPRHARFLTEELVPALERRFPLRRDPRHRCLMGASFGAVATLSTAARYPGFYGRLLLQSGSFAFSDIGDHDRGPVFDPVVRFVNGFRENPGYPSDKVYVSCGTYESLIYENRTLVPVLQATGMDVRYEEARDGHNWENWRDRLRTALSWLFPGPLWMVYE